MALRPLLTKALSRFTEAMVSGLRFSGSYDHAGYRAGRCALECGGRLIQSTSVTLRT